jgi:hypothetical protein
MPVIASSAFTFADVNDPAVVVLVVGIRGMGKTSIVKERVIDEAFRVVIFDPKREYHDAHVTLTEFEAICKRGALPDKYIIAVYPGKMRTEDDILTAVTKFGDICEDYIRNTVIVFDEAGLMEGQNKAKGELNYFATQSRHWQCPLVYVAQRAYQVPTTVRSQATVIVSFAQSAKNDVKELEDRFSLRNPDLVGVISTLNEHEYMVWRFREPSAKRET